MRSAVCFVRNGPPLRLARSAIVLLAALSAIAVGGFARSDGATNSTVRHSSASSTLAVVSYRSVVEPFLKERCSSCHSPAGHAGGLNVESPATLLKGGSTTGAKLIVAGASERSSILRYLRGDGVPRMPLNGAPVPASTIAIVARWIDQGARVDAEKLVWHYAPPKLSAVPHVHDSA